MLMHLARGYDHDHNIMELWARLRPSPQSRKVDVCPDTAAQLVLAKLHEYLVCTSDLNRRVLSNMTSVSDVIVMSHARRWLFKAVPAKMDMAPVYTLS